MAKAVTKMKKKEREDLVQDAGIEELYEKLTMWGIKELEEYEDDFLSEICLVHPKRALIWIPIGPDKDKAEKLVNSLFETGEAIAVITIGKGWAAPINENGEKPILPLKHHPKSYEFFSASLESKEIKKIKIWKIKRDEKGRMMFPLGEPEVALEDFKSRSIGTYSRVTQKD